MDITLRVLFEHLLFLKVLQWQVVHIANTQSTLKMTTSISGVTKKTKGLWTYNGMDLPYLFIHHDSHIGSILALSKTDVVPELPIKLFY